MLLHGRQLCAKLDGSFKLHIYTRYCIRECYLAIISRQAAKGSKYKSKL